MNNAVNLQSMHIRKTKKKYLCGKRCRYAGPACTITKKHWLFRFDMSFEWVKWHLCSCFM